MSTHPNKALLDRINQPPCITAAGEEWPIPKLAPKQNQTVVPIILALWPKMLAIREAKDKMAKLFELMEGDNLKLMYDCVFLAIQRGHPDLTREEFDEMEVGVLEAFESLYPIAQQTGLIKIGGGAGASDTPAGEAQPTSQIGSD
jgi:hypothetical protein